MVKNTHTNLIPSVKMLNIGVINKYTTNKETGGGLFSIVCYQFLSNFFSLAPPNYFCL